MWFHLYYIFNRPFFYYLLIFIMSNNMSCRCMELGASTGLGYWPNIFWYALSIEINKMKWINEKQYPPHKWKFQCAFSLATIALHPPNSRLCGEDATNFHLVFDCCQLYILRHTCLGRGSSALGGKESCMSAELARAFGDRVCALLGGSVLQWILFLSLKSRACALARTHPHSRKAYESDNIR